MAEKHFLGGVTNTTLILDGDKTHVFDTQDCQAILDANQRGRDHRFSADSPEGTVTETFQIPMVVLMKFSQECGHRLFTREFDEYMNKQLKQPEFAYLVSAPRSNQFVKIKGAR